MHAHSSLQNGWNNVRIETVETGKNTNKQPLTKACIKVEVFINH